MIDFSKFFEYIRSREISEQKATEVYGIPKPRIQSMRHNGNLRADTIDKICNSLGCQPGDICSHIPDDNRYIP